MVRLLLLLLFGTSLAMTNQMTQKHIQIHDLTNNPGLVSIQMGHGRIKIGSHKIFHILDLAYVESTIRKLRTITNDLKIFNVEDSVALINRKLDIIQKSYTHLLPISRSKRGLFDGVGSMIKVITGNLDNQDLIKINMQLDDLLNQNKALVTENNEQVRINHKVQDRINRIINTLNDQQNVIKNNFIGFRQDIINGKNTSDEIKIVKEIFNLNLNIDIMATQVNNIFEAIQMSKVKVISKDILSTEELNEATKILENENVIIDSFDQTIEYLDLIVIHKHTKIVFIVLIPTLQKDIFEHQLLEPVVKNGKLLDLHYTQALSNDHSTYLIIGECMRAGQSVICSRQHIKDVSKDTCYSKLLRGLSGTCDLVEATAEQQVKQITSNYILITGQESIPITSNCGISNRSLSGSTLLFFRNCTVTVNNTSFTDIEYVAKQQPFIIPLNGLEIIEKTISTNFTLQKLKEVNLQTRQQLQNLHRQQKNSTIGTSIAIIAVVIILILYLITSHSTRFRQPNHQSEPRRSVLQEGAVSERIEPSSITKNSNAPTASARNANIIQIPSSLLRAQRSEFSLTQTTTTTTTSRPTGHKQTLTSQNPTPYIRT